MRKINGYKGALKGLAAVMALLVITGAMAGCSAPQGKNQAAEDKAPEEVYPVKTIKAETAKFADTVQITGTAEAVEQAQVAAKISGEVYALTANMGDMVKAGQILARIDDTRYALAKDKAGLGVSSAQISLEQQEADLARYKSLYEQNAISQKEYEAAVNGYKMTEISYKSAQADLRSANINLKDTGVTAPINGIVSQRKINQGESVNPGTPMFEIVDISKIAIVSGVPEDMVNQLSPGMKVRVEVVSAAVEPFEGTITQISPVPDQAKLYPVKIEIDNSKNLIKVGMFATGAVSLSEGIEGIAVPKEAVAHDNGKDYIYVVESGKAIRKEVAIGLGDETRFHVKSGLNDGEEVVIVGQGKLQNGSLIKVTE